MPLNFRISNSLKNVSFRISLTVLMFPRIKKYVFSALLACLFILFTCATHAVEFKKVGPPFINFKQLAGEELTNVTALIQDHNGFHWIINETGLLRFDGNEFKLFSGLEQFNAATQASVIEGEDGRLWITSINVGLAMFDTKSETLNIYDLNESFNIKATENSGQSLINILSYHRKNIYFSTGNTIVKVDEKSLVVVREITIEAAVGSTIGNFLVSYNDDIWVSLEQVNGVHLITGKDVIHFEHKPNVQNSISSSYVTSIFEDNQKRLWFAGIAGIDQFMPNSQTFARHIPFDLSLQVNENKNALSNFILSISQGTDDFLWLSLLREGMVKFDPVNATFEHFPNRKGIPTTVVTDSMHAGGTFDKNNTLWISTKKGLSKLLSSHQNVDQLANIDNETCKALALYENKYGLYFSCNKTLYKFAKGSVRVVKEFNEKIISIVQGDDKSIWVGSIGGGLYSFDQQNDLIKTFNFSSDVKQQMGVNITHKLRIDTQGELFGIAHEHPTEVGSGILHYNKEQDTFTNSATGVILSSMLNVNEDKLLLISGYSSAPQKLAWFDKKTYKTQILPIKTGSVLAVAKRANTLWVSTELLGLIIIDIDSGEWSTKLKADAYKITGFYQHTQSNDLYLTLDNQLHKLIEIIDGSLQSLCITCNLSLSSAPKNDLFLGQSYIDSSYLTQNNTFITSSENLLTTIDLNNWHPSADKQTLLLTDYKVMGQSQVPSLNDTKASLQKNIGLTKHLTITPDTTYFSLSFASVGAIKPHETQYAYMLEGLNESWISAKAGHAQADYSLLPAGEYTFRVKATNDKGIWGDETSLSITVLPKWWQSWWAYSLYILLVGYVIRLFYRTKLAERERAMSAELVTAKEQIFADISHECRTPLTLILGPAKNIRTSTNDKVTMQHMTLIERNAQRLLVMFDQLLQLTQLKDSNITKQAPVHVASICTSVANAFAPIAKEQQITLTLPSQINNMWWVNGEQNALETILFNLLSNAFKFTQGPGHIQLSIDEKQQMLEFSVIDSGCGLAEQHYEKIFERFTRIESNSEGIAGVGIGLALVKGLVNALGGTINVKSSLNEGSTFTFSLPKVTHNEQRSDEASSNNFSAKESSLLANELSALQNIDKSSLDAQPNLSINDDNHLAARPTILIVDDNQDIRVFLHICLADEYSIIESENGQQALSMALEHSPDLIISDVMMPIMDGFELLDNVRRNMAVSHIPFILLTAKNDQKSKLKGLSELADDYMTKPFDKDELLLRVKGLLSIRQILQQRFSTTNLDNDVKELQSKVHNNDALAVQQDLSFIEQEFITKLTNTLGQNYVNSTLTLPMVASELAMSERQLQRKLKAISGTSFSELLRDYRLTKGQQLLSSGEQIGVIADQVGFTSSSYFVRCFKAKYGTTPNEYRNLY